MARRKHHHKRKHSRRRKHSMSGVGGEITNTLSMVVGAVAGRYLYNKLTTLTKPIDGKIVSGGEIVVGYFLPKLIKNKMMQGVGNGMLVSGAVNMLAATGVIAGIDNLMGYDNYSVDYVSGTDNLTAIAGGVGLVDQGIMTGDTDRLNVVAGDLEDMQMGYSEDESEY